MIRVSSIAMKESISLALSCKYLLTLGGKNIDGIDN